MIVDSFRIRSRGNLLQASGALYPVAAPRRRARHS